MEQTCTLAAPCRGKRYLKRTARERQGTEQESHDGKTRYIESNIRFFILNFFGIFAFMLHIFLISAAREDSRVGKKAREQTIDNSANYHLSIT